MTASEPNLPDDFSDVEEISTSSGKLRVTLEIVTAILILVGIYYLFAPEDQIELPPLQQQEIDPIIRAQIDAAEGAPVQPGAIVPLDSSQQVEQPVAAQSEETQAVASPKADGEAAREIIAALRSDSDTRSLQEITRQGNEFNQQGRRTDAYLLWFYAARQGDGEAAFALASLNDPNHFEPGNPLLTGADANQAYKWYSQAARQSYPQASERLQALRATLEAQAETGDLSAQRLLLNWP